MNTKKAPKAKLPTEVHGGGVTIHFADRHGNVLGKHGGKAPKSGPVPSTLSDVLSDSVPSRYHTSTQAALGIVKRAYERAKPIPLLLEMGVAELIASKAGKVVAGIGTDTVKAELVRKLLIAYLDPALHQQAVGACWYSPDTTPKFGDGTVANTLRAFQGGGGVGVAFRIGTFSAGQGAKAGGIGWSEEVTPTLKGSPSGNNQVPSVVHGFRESAQYGRYEEHDGIAGTLRASGGYTGGGSETLLVKVYTENQRSEVRDLGGVASCLTQPSGKQYDIVVSASAGGIPAVGADVDHLTLAELADLAQRTYEAVGRRYIVRKLTPWECLRLQGFSDDHCTVDFGKGGKITDAAEMLAFHANEGRAISEANLKTSMADSHIYKAAGNSMAVPCLMRIAGAAEFEGGIQMRMRARGDLARRMHKMELLGGTILDYADLIREVDKQVFAGNGTSDQVHAEVEKELDRRYYGKVVPR